MIYKNLETPKLLEIAIEKEGCSLTEDGALVTYTGEYTGRCPTAKYIVNEKQTKTKVDWSENQKMTKGAFNKMKRKFLNTVKDKEVYLQDALLIRDPEHAIGFRVYTEYARHSQFVRNMFITKEQVVDSPEVADIYTILHLPSLLDEPRIMISVSEKLILISGTYYAGEIKKAAFTLINFLTPSKGFLPMHCSVNVDKGNENPTIFFGLSGTGKTTLSADPNRVLIGDDEHLWTDNGLTNIEGGCYAKTIRLSETGEPEIWNACKSVGTILENVVMKDGKPDFDDGSVTENGRASYSTDVVPNSHIMGYVNKHPKNIVMLTCDAFGVLPPVMKLSTEEAVQQFKLGYTAKVAGTEKGVKEPAPTFSACFGQPFMPLKVDVYANLLKSKIEEHNVNCWLVNTGWTGGGYGKGKRISLETTRKIINLILTGEFSKVMFTKHRYTGFSIPLVNYAPNNIMFPEQGWADIEEYKKTANDLIKKLKPEQ
mgnify:FL=1